MSKYIIPHRGMQLEIVKCMADLGKQAKMKHTACIKHTKEKPCQTNPHVIGFTLTESNGAGQAKPVNTRTKQRTKKDKGTKTNDKN
jgi:hypothetical protein